MCFSNFYAYSIHHAKLTPGWALIRAKFDPIQEIEPKVGDGHSLTRLWYIRESMDTLCRDGADVQHVQYFKQKLCNLTTNMLKAYLIVQFVSAFMISKTHIVAQKPHGR